MAVQPGSSIAPLTYPLCAGTGRPSRSITRTAMAALGMALSLVHPRLLWQQKSKRGRIWTHTCRRNSQIRRLPWDGGEMERDQAYQMWIRVFFPGISSWDRWMADLDSLEHRHRLRLLWQGITMSVLADPS